MLHKNKLVTFASLTAFVWLGVAAIQPATKKDRNLKVLPKDISDARLDSIMQTYNIALGVKCGFCHLPAKNMPDSLDYAADGEPMKEEARKMITMTIKINKENFWYNKLDRPEYLNTVHCNTCHRGEAFPEH
jgi:hypothetical protein